AAAASAPLVLRASSDSWIQARDANGRVLLSRLVAAGASVGLDGALPIRLTIGNAAGTAVEFQGRPIDLTPATRNNVARIVVQ
ncbi:MAG: DUF4115 domain-containing protein, partial [Burkholderiales bacterium]|nr:DUF4115 domain-containing protein [Burkholderiales bacterium]